MVVDSPSVFTLFLERSDISDEVIPISMPIDDWQFNDEDGGENGDEDESASKDDDDDDDGEVEEGEEENEDEDYDDDDDDGPTCTK